jgi:hypothetical protein
MALGANKAALGGEAGFHGGGGRDRDGAAGCIAPTDGAIDERWATLRVGDFVVVEPRGEGPSVGFGIMSRTFPSCSG